MVNFHVVFLFYFPFLGFCFCGQLREAKADAQATGEATRKDIEKLRGLHAKRVRRLEALLKEEAENLADARREIGRYRYTYIHTDIWNLVSHGVPVSKRRGRSRRSGTRRGVEVEAERASQS